MLSTGFTGEPAITLLSTAEFPKDIHGDAAWLPDGRLLFQRTEAGASTNWDDKTCNFWSMRVDVHTGRLVEKLKPLTNWTGFCIWNANATGNGKRLAFLRSKMDFTLYVADLEPGGAGVRGLRHFTQDESNNALQDWTMDSKNIILTSNRTSRVGIYKQALDGDTPQLISNGDGDFRDTQVAPDGKWLFGIEWKVDTTEPARLMRIPLRGGIPEVVTTAVVGVFCARPPSTLCVMSTKSEDGKQAIFSSVDPEKGPGRELARLAVDPDANYFDFDVSPDGTRIAAAGNAKGPIHVLSLIGQPERVIPATFQNMEEFHWSANGAGLYVPDQTKTGTALLYLDLHGKSRIVWENPGARWIWARPSPDGRHLAISTSRTSSNFWIMENL